MTTPLLEQWQAARSRPALAAACAFFGGMPPAFAYWITHYELRGAAGQWAFEWSALAVPFALAYSVCTVYQWGSQAFDDRFKAVCLVATFELVMITSRTPWLALAALAGLVLVNAIATTSTLLAELPAAPTVAKRAAEPVPKVPARVLEPSRAVATRRPRAEVPT